MIPLGCDGGLHITFTSVFDTTLVLNCTTPGAKIKKWDPSDKKK